MMQCIKKYRITFRKYKYNDETKGRKKRKKLNKLKYFNSINVQKLHLWIFQLRKTIPKLKEAYELVLDKYIIIINRALYR